MRRLLRGGRGDMVSLSRARRWLEALAKPTVHPCHVLPDMPTHPCAFTGRVETLISLGHLHTLATRDVVLGCAVSVCADAAPSSQASRAVVLPAERGV